VINDCGAAVALADADFRERFEAIREQIPRLQALVTGAAEGIPAVGLSVADLLGAPGRRPP
jgi:hypothetical protein